MSSAIQDGKYLHTSASQLTLFRTCPRRWFASYRLGIKEPPNEAFERGTKIHTQMEDFYEKGVIPTSPSARLLLEDPRMPARGGKDILVEHPRDYHTGMYVWYDDADEGNEEAPKTLVKGRIDMLHAASDRHVRIIDFKSKGSAKYMPTPESLTTDLQLAMYATYTFKTFPSVEEVTLYHGCIGSHNLEGKPPDPANPETLKAPFAKLVETPPLRREDIEPTYSTIKAAVREAQKIAAIEDVENVPATPGRSTCFSYGKICPFAANCSAFQQTQARLTPTASDEPQTVETPEGEKKMSLKEKIAARARAGAATSVVPAPEAAVSSSSGGINPIDANFYPPSAKGTDDSVAARLDAIEKRLAKLEGDAS